MAKLPNKIELYMSAEMRVVFARLGEKLSDIEKRIKKIEEMIAELAPQKNTKAGQRVSRKD